MTRAKMIVMGVGSVVLLMVTMGLLGNVVEKYNADEVMVIQDPIDGDLHWYTGTGGTVFQRFGSVTKYPKRSIYEFEAPVQFNDGGKGIIHGSVQYDLPLDIQNLNELHTRFGSAEAIQKQVIEVVTNKVIYMTGPVMSSRESYAEKRNYLINYAQDQIDNGVYQTRRVQTEEVDQFSGQKKVVTTAEIVLGEDGRPARQERSVVGEFGIRAFNFSIEQIDYDDTVEKQIQDQQRITMDVQTSIADALKAQQAAITTEQQGRAEAAKAKWAQEVEKARVVTRAEQELEVQRLATKRAEMYKQEQTLRGEADAAYRKKLLEADGALELKTRVWLEAQKEYAKALGNHQLVPSVVMGGSGQGSNAQALTLIELLTAKAAKELALDLGVK